MRFRDADAAKMRAAATALPEAQLDGLIEELRSAVLRVPEGTEAEAAARLAARHDVAYALPIPRARAVRAPNDVRLEDQWALTRIGAPAAWDVVTSSSGVIIAVVDTGIDLTHPDLAGQIWTNPGETPANGLDDDGNGKVDDVHGWHFYQICSGGECLALEDANVQDDHGHGTHVAGIAAASTDNGIGIAGVSWGATIMPIKVLDSTGEGWYDDIIRGILYAVHNGARIINLSVGGDEPFEPLREALSYASQQGALTLAAAGNEGKDVLYPARYPEALAIAATDTADARASFSNWGEAISVAAPGVGIASTWSWHSYRTMSGTSMATPHVAGVAALIWTLHPEYSPSQVARTIELSAHDANAETLPGRDPEIGWGRIDAGRAVRQNIYRYQVPLLHRGG